MQENFFKKVVIITGILAIVGQFSGCARYKGWLGVTGHEYENMDKQVLPKLQLPKGGMEQSSRYTVAPATL